MNMNMNENRKNKRKQTIKIGILITSLFVIFSSVTYAFINMNLTGEKRQVITSGNLELELDEDENNLQIVDALPMYDEVGMLQEAFTFRLINKTSQSAEYILKIENITVGETLSKDDVKYGLIKNDEVIIDLVSTIEDGVIDQGTIPGNETIEYSLRLWIKDSITDISTIQSKSIHYKMNMNASPRMTPITAKSIIFDTAEKNLGESCKTYNDGVDTFLVGQCQNNYVWYSGKLWRIVLKNNETGAVKMITDNAVTAIYFYNTSLDNFNNHNHSYVNQWLKQEFLPTLHDYQDYLVTDSIWDATSDISSSPIRPNEKITVNQPIGLLNAYEYYTTYNNSGGIAASETGYLNNKTHWELINRQYVLNNGTLSSSKSKTSGGVRPSINLKAEIGIMSGTGTIDNPYRLIGDTQETINGETLLNTKYSGEYVIFNNELYRIVGVEDNLTKIIAVNTPESLTSKFLNNLYPVQTELETYYQGLDSNIKNMIEPNTIWYTSSISGFNSGTNSNYKNAICSSFNADISIKDCPKTTTTETANIFLPRYGEIFTSQITREKRINFFTLTKSSNGLIYINGTTGLPNETGISSSSYSYLHPSMYLKSNVVISKDNTGDGTYENPYSIELSE